MSQVFDPTPCALGEGPLWHPERKQLFWFDIMRHRLHSRVGDETLTWQFEEHVSAAGWVDSTRLLIASETQLFLFDIDEDTTEFVAPLEAENATTSSNDGRADPWGGLWIGTMGKSAEPSAGAIYRYYRGEVRKLFGDITISNAICFAPDGSCAYFTDTVTKVIMRQNLSDKDGWLVGEPEPWLDLTAEGLNPDGAVVDAQGNLWNAQWGAHRVACYDPAGHFQHAVDFAAAHTSCPAFGGDDLTTLFCTSARADLSAEALEAVAEHGMTFAALDAGKGQAEHKVIL